MLFLELLCSIGKKIIEAVDVVIVSTTHSIGRKKSIPTARFISTDLSTVSMPFTYQVTYACAPRPITCDIASDKFTNAKKVDERSEEDEPDSENSDPLTKSQRGPASSFHEGMSEIQNFHLPSHSMRPGRRVRAK